MSYLISVDVERPSEGKQVLLYWKDSRHFEDGAFYKDEDTDNWYHSLFDGEALNEQPSHWMPLPELPRG